MLVMWEICICARPSECKRVVVCYSYILSTNNQSITVVSLFPEDENLHLPNRVSDR